MIRDLPEPLAEPQTSWTLLNQANDIQVTEAVRTAARQEVIQRYLPFAERYLLLALGGRTELVPALISEFSVRVMNGNALAHVTPEKGRFRDYLRTILKNLVRDHYRYQGRAHEQLNEMEEANIEAKFSDQTFYQQWRIELTMQAMQAMGNSERARDRELYAVLQLKMAPKKMSLAAMALQLTNVLGRPVNAAWVGRQTFAARERLRDLVRREVRKSLFDPTEEAVNEELADLGMLEFVRKK